MFSKQIGAHLIDTSAGGLLIPEFFIDPVVSASALTCGMGYWTYSCLTITVPK